MITKLTTKQTDRFQEFVQKWLQIGLSIEPSNRRQANEGLLKLFFDAKIKPPNVVIWLDSPLQGIIAKKMFLDSNVRSQVGSQVFSQVHSQVGSQVDLQVLSQVGSQVRSQVGSQVGYFYVADYGLHQSGWLSFYDFFYQLFDEMKFIEKFSGYFEIAKSCGWIYDVTIKEVGDVVIFTERPCKIKRDINFSLHADGEMALQYPDGWGVYAYHGVKLPYMYGSVKQNQWKPEWILTEGNAELRRVLIQNIGYAKMCKDLEAKTLDKWREYELLKIENVDIEPVVMLKMVCPSTKLIHAHRVAPNIVTAREAIVAINQGINPESFVSES